MSALLVFALIAAVRGGVPLLVLRRPFAGALACIAADAFDTVVQDALGVHPIEDHYHRVDKGFDLYYLAFEAATAWRLFDPLAKSTAVVLFGCRAAAVALFEVTGWRALLLFPGPNIFENFFLFVAGMQVIDRGYRIGSKARLAVVLVFAGAPKVLQEYVMHYREAQTWHFVRDDLLLWWR